MKNLLFTLLWGMLFLQMQAQEYQPIFGNEATKWIVTSKYTTPEEITIDTILVVATENEYKVLEYRQKWDWNTNRIGKMRANETNSKLYLIEQDTETEVLIMDLDLSIGDSFNMKAEYDEYRTLYVEDVYILDGKKHIRFNEIIGTSTPPGNIKRMFIEGVGPNWGFEVEPMIIACKYDDFVQTYSFENEYIKDCGFSDGTYIDEIAIENDIKIHPNPTSDQVVIHIPEISSENIYLTIYNSLGIRILSRSLSHTETILDLSHFPNHIYYLKLQTTNGMVTKKIVKTDNTNNL
jgi:hypothetical protein